MMRHYAFDCETRAEFRVDAEYIFHCLAHMAFFLGVDAIGSPIIRPYRDNECPFEDSGVSAFVFLKNGGHITIHTFDARRRFYADVLSESKRSAKAIAEYMDAYILPIDFAKSAIRSLKSPASEQYDPASHFGKHLIYKVKTDRYDDMGILYCDLEFIAKHMLKMHTITNPFVVLDEKGLHGIVLIAESHVSIHNCGKYAYIDAFSCKGFDEKRLDEYLSDCGQIVSKDSYARATVEEW